MGKNIYFCRKYHEKEKKNKTLWTYFSTFNRLDPARK